MSNRTTVLITGASTGIGAVYADRFAKRGHNVILVARDFERLELLSNRLWAETGVNVEVEVADLTNKADLLRIEERLRTDPKIDILVNNAGIGAFGPVVNGDADKFETVIDLNVTAPTRLATAAATAFAKRGHGSIINLSSVLALAPERTNPVYGGTKAFLLNFSQALAHQAEEIGVHVQVVLPGATRTEIWERGGVDVNALDPKMVMDVHDLVDAALAGFDAGESVTIPSLPDVKDWQSFESARLWLAPNLSRNRPAPRYGVNTAAQQEEPVKEKELAWEDG
ncbi:MAG TPA: SDR family oxidoreductase [Hyphomonadaceae bacterium]|nr:SDR family oxidoreductase [Hyphomonadaceae bacterium]